MEQKTVISLEFTRGEEKIAAAVMALVADARDNAGANAPKPSAQPERAESARGEERPTRPRRDEPEEERRPARTQRDEPEEEPEGGKYTEIQLRDMPTKKLTDILKKEFGVDPGDYEGVNTNKKLRTLILDAQAGTLNDPEPEDSGNDPEPEDERRPQQGNRQDEVTHDDIRDLMAEVIDADDANRAKVLKQLTKIGAKSVGTIRDEDVAEFFEFLQTLKEG